jgi:N-acetylglucosaminyldiphosphoundecaprenol N-acetyl-beta-D-mannosaminyltransferase
VAALEQGGSRLQAPSLGQAGWPEPAMAALYHQVGAAFDFHTGRVKQSPRWMQRLGLEWFYRVCQEPRRLAGRYFRNNPLFIWRLIKEALG